MASVAEIVDVLSNVEDPEIGMNIVDLGLIYGLRYDDEGGQVHIELTLTSPGCPLGPEIIRNIKQELGTIEDVLDSDVDLVWKPLWNPAMMSDWAKDELGYDDEFGLGMGMGRY